MLYYTRWTKKLHFQSIMDHVAATNQWIKTYTETYSTKTFKEFKRRKAVYQIICYCSLICANWLNLCTHENVISLHRSDDDDDFIAITKLTLNKAIRIMFVLSLLWLRTIMYKQIIHRSTWSQTVNILSALQAYDQCSGRSSTSVPVQGTQVCRIL